MKYGVTIIAIGDDGEPVWEFAHSEIVADTGSISGNATALVEATLERLEEAGDSVRAQIAAWLPLVAEHAELEEVQAELERRRRERGES
jgi:hypothetical protein